MAAHQGRTALYRLYNGAGRVIYVGISSNPIARWQAHAADKPWWSDVVTREIEWHESRPDAERAEAREIGALQPEWNTAPGMPDRSVPVTQRIRRGWTPPQYLLDLVAEYQSQQDALAATRDRMEAALVAEMMAGVSADRMAKFLPWEPTTLRRIAKAGGVPPLRERTVVSARKTH